MCEVQVRPGNSNFLLSPFCQLRSIRIRTRTVSSPPLSAFWIESQLTFHPVHWILCSAVWFDFSLFLFISILFIYICAILCIVTHFMSFILGLLLLFPVNLINGFHFLSKVDFLVLQFQPQVQSTFGKWWQINRDEWKGGSRLCHAEGVSRGIRVDFCSCTFYQHISLTTDLPLKYSRKLTGNIPTAWR